MELIVELYDDSDRSLLEKCALIINPRADRMYVTPLGREGYSGSHLYAAWARAERTGSPAVIKVNSLDKTREEWARIEEMYGFFGDAKGVKGPVEEAARGALIYPFVAKRRGDLEIEEFRDIVFEDLNDSAAADRLVGLVETVYERGCKDAHVCRREAHTLGEQYKWYLRRDEGTGRDFAAERLDAFFGPDHISGRFELLGAEVVDPRPLLAELETREVELTVADAVHGDLHPNNILIDEDGNPRLIDFAWGQQHAHVLKDFTLLECSLRFFLFATNAHPDEQRTADEHLLRADGPDALLKDASSMRLGPHYDRLGRLLQTVRTGAKQVTCGDFEQEYLLSQFMILYGLLKHPGYHFLYSARALGMIGLKLA